MSDSSHCLVGTAAAGRASIDHGGQKSPSASKLHQHLSPEWATWNNASAVLGRHTIALGGASGFRSAVVLPGRLLCTRACLECPP
eukprot:1281645-Alexandrium_andersonii.AAC.1